MLHLSISTCLKIYMFIAVIEHVLMEVGTINDSTAGMARYGISDRGGKLWRFAQGSVAFCSQADERARPLYARLFKNFDTSISEPTLRPNPRFAVEQQQDGWRVSAAGAASHGPWRHSAATSALVHIIRG
jgi:hypothetical protein